MAKRKAFKSHKRQRIFNKTNGRCGYCGIKLAKDNFQVDHIYPLCKGGTNLDINLVASCNLCNQTKGKMSVVEFKRYILSKDKELREKSSKYRLLEHFGIVWVKKQAIIFYLETCKN